MALPFPRSLSIVVPAYNERENLPRVLDDLLAVAPRTFSEFEIRVIDDGSTDGTHEVLAAYLDRSEVRLVRHGRNQGLTGALRTGFLGAEKELVTWVPADGQIPAAELARILDAWRGEDLLLSRYDHRPDGFVRAAMSRGLRVLLWLTLGFRDRLEGPYLFRRALLDDMELVARRSAGSIGFEIGAKARQQGRRVGSTEIGCAPRLSGRSKVANARNIAAYLDEIWRIRRSMRRRSR